MQAKRGTTVVSTEINQLLQYVMLSRHCLDIASVALIFSSVGLTLRHGVAFPPGGCCTGSATMPVTMLRASYQMPARCETAQNGDCRHGRRCALHCNGLNSSAQFPRSYPGRGTRLISMCSNPPSTMIS